VAGLTECRHKRRTSESVETSEVHVGAAERQLVKIRISTLKSDGRFCTREALRILRVWAALCNLSSYHSLDRKTTE
jgi:hypothetical protein